MRIRLKEKDVYKQFSLLTLMERNRHVIKERFFLDRGKKSEKEKREVDCTDNVRSLTKKETESVIAVDDRRKNY